MNTEVNMVVPPNGSKPIPMMCLSKCFLPFCLCLVSCFMACSTFSRRSGFYWLPSLLLQHGIHSSGGACLSGSSKHCLLLLTLWQHPHQACHHVCCPLVLQVHPFDTAAHEARIEAELKRALGEHRGESLGHTPTHWDEGMAFLLMPSLAAYEQEAVTGQPAASNEDFQQCIRRSIPAGCMFKGFPQHHRYCALTKQAHQD